MKTSSNKLLRSKRGEDMLVDFFTILFFALIVLLFFILFSTSRKESIQEISSEFKGQDTNYMLQSFLRSPAVGIDSSKTVADIIIEDSINDNYDRTEQLFGNYYKYSTLVSGWRVNDIILTVGDHDIKIIMEGGNNAFGKIVRIVTEEARATIIRGAPGSVGIAIHEESESYYANTILPSYTGRINVELEVTVWTIDT